MNLPAHFLWHDYETFGIHPALDRPAQFAALRTDAELNIQGDALEWFCAPADDVLPHPVACLLTGITPQDAGKKGVCEAEFSRLIHTEMMQPGTCSAGYNSLRFDDEFTRNLLYRNFRDPYEREYRNGNSRWDLIDLVRMCFALRPAGIEWPLNDEGKPSFRLEHLTAANNIGHEGAHDALADVRATISLARLVRARQPRLFDWALGLRDQKQVIKMLDVLTPSPILHTSARIPPERGCTSLFLPLAMYPDRPKSVIAFDLMADPAQLIDAAAEQIADLVFTPRNDLPDGLRRLPLKAIHSNKIPMLAPVATLKGVDTARIALDPARCEEHAKQILRHLDEIRFKVMEVFTRPHEDRTQDPDLMIYSGDFFSRQDRRIMDEILRTPPAQLGTRNWPFKDARLPEMLFRYRARNFPDTLDQAEADRWQAYRNRQLTQPDDDRSLSYADFQAALAQARKEHAGDGRAQGILDHLQAWSVELGLPATAGESVDA